MYLCLLHSHMNSKYAASRFLLLYQDIYHHLHFYWDKDERALSPEAIAVMNHLALCGPLTVSEAVRHFDRAQSHE